MATKQKCECGCGVDVGFQAPLKAINFLRAQAQ